MSYRLLNSMPKCRKAYLVRAIDKDMAPRELQGKAILVIGDVQRKDSKTEYDNISKQVAYPTITLVSREPSIESVSNKVGQFEVAGQLSSNGILSISDIGPGSTDFISKEYTKFVRNNPVFAEIYAMQKGVKKVISPLFVANASDEDVRKYCGLDRKTSIEPLREAANQMLSLNVNSYFDGIVINGNRIKDGDIEQIIDLFKNSTIPVRLISASGTCPISDISKQRSVIITQNILDIFRNYPEDFTYTHTQRLKERKEGKCRVISMISMPGRKRI